MFSILICCHNAFRVIEDLVVYAFIPLMIFSNTSPASFTVSYLFFYYPQTLGLQSVTLQGREYDHDGGVHMVPGWGSKRPSRI